MTIKKTLYFLLMGLVFIGSGFFWTQVPFHGDTNVVFRINSLGVTWRYIVDIVIGGVLLWLFLLSWLHFRIPIDTRHTTTINKR